MYVRKLTSTDWSVPYQLTNYGTSLTSERRKMHLNENFFFKENNLPIFEKLEEIFMLNAGIIIFEGRGNLIIYDNSDS